MSVTQLKKEAVGVLRAKLHITVEETLKGTIYAYATIKTFQQLTESDAQLVADEFQRVNPKLPLMFEWQQYKIHMLPNM